MPCKLKSTSGSNTSTQYPLQVSVEFGYYQMSASKRRIITCEINYSLYTESSSNFSYNLVVSFRPLTHTQIMLNFGFDWFIYMLVFMIIGAISNFEFILFWLYHILVAAKRRWSCHVQIYLKLLREIFKGVLPAFALIVYLTFLVEVVMNGTFFGKLLSTTYSTFWNHLVLPKVGHLATNTQQGEQSGRMGFSYVVISVYLLVALSDQLVCQ